MRDPSYGNEFALTVGERRLSKGVTALDAIANCLAQLSLRIANDARTDDGILRAQFADALTELGVLRDTIAKRLRVPDARSESLKRIDAVLADLNSVLASLPDSRAPNMTESCVVSTLTRAPTARLENGVLRRVTLALGITAAALAVGGIAVPAAAEHATTPTFIGMTPEDVGVLNRSRPEYDAKGIPLGGFRLFPSLALNATYDDNVFRQPASASDFFFEEAPTIRLQSQWGRHSLEFYGGADNFNYAKFGRLDLTDWTIGSDGRLDVSRAIDISAAGSYGKYHEALGSANTVGFQAAPNRYFKGHLESIGRYQPNRIGVSIGGSYDRYDWQSTPRLGGGLLFNTDRDESVYQGYVKANYDFSPGYSGFVKGLYDSRHFDQFFDRSGLHRSSTGYRLDAGLDMQLTHLLAGEVYVGYLTQNYSKNVPIPLKSISGVDYGVGLDWFASPVLTVHLNGAHLITDVTVAGASASDDKLIKLSADYEFRRNIIVMGYVSYTDSHLAGTIRTDNYPGAGIAVKYLLNRYMSADINYNFNERSSSTAGLRYSDNMISVGLSLHI